MRRHIIYCLAVALMAALVLPLLSMSSSSADDSFYVSNQSRNASGLLTGTVSKFNANNGNFQGVLITAAAGGTPGGNFTPNGIVVNRVTPPELVVANQNAETPLNGEIRVFDEATGALKRVLVPANDANAPFAPFAILLYGSELLIADEGPGPTVAGRIEAFNATTGSFVGPFSTTGYVNANDFHPFGMVVGPDGKLYVASRPLPHGPETPSDVIRFDLTTKQFLNVFVSGASCGCNLDHPSGVVFGPDGRLYVTSSRPSPAATNDTDKILIFDGTTGTFVRKINLDSPGGPRSVAPGLLFGPQGPLLYVTIAQAADSGDPIGVGSVRRYNAASGMFRDIVPPNTNLNVPTLFTFGGTNPTTLVYEE
jgi:hypothetical protein